MTVKEFKEYMESHGFVWNKKHGFEKSYKNGKYDLKMKYQMKRDLVTSIFVDSVGREHKSMKARLRNLKVTDKGELVGFKQINDRTVYKEIIEKDEK